MSERTTDRQLVTILLLLLGAMFVLPVLFAGFGMMGFGMMGAGPMTGGMWGGGTGAGTVSGWALVVSAVTRLLFLGAIVVAGYLVYRAAVRSSDGADPALSELRLRYARGDLSDEEYERRREALERKP